MNNRCMKFCKLLFSQCARTALTVTSTIAASIAASVTEPNPIATSQSHANPTSAFSGSVEWKIKTAAGFNLAKN